MASVAISAKTILISGVTPDSGTTAASGDTCTITAPSGDALDFDNLVIRAYVATAGAILTFSASSGYSSLDQGTYSVTVATAGTVLIGGKDFESARFKQVSAQSCVITCTSRYTGSVPSVYFEAGKLPSGFTG